LTNIEDEYGFAKLLFGVSNKIARHEKANTID